MDSSLELVFPEGTETSAAAEDLGLDDEVALLLLSELPGDKERLLAVEGDVADGDGDSVLVKELGSLILMKLQASHGQVLVHHEGPVASFGDCEGVCSSQSAHTRHLVANQVKHLFYLII